MRHFFFVFVASISISTALSGKPRLHVVTVANYQALGLDRLLYSAEYFGHEVTVLGMDKPYPNHFVKVHNTLDFAQSIPSQDLILFVDAFDVMILGTEDEIVSRFLEFKKPCLFGAERNYHPKASVFDLIGEYPHSPTSLQYLNSGTYIGYAKYVKDMIRTVLRRQHKMPIKRMPKRFNDDQYHFHRYFARAYDEVERDVYAKIFFPLTNINENELVLDSENKTIFFTETGEFPLVIHGNGKGLPKMIEIFDEFFPNVVKKPESL